MYNYKSSIKADIEEYLNTNYTENEINELLKLDPYKAEEKLNDEMWAIDSITGNGSGSYTFSSYIADHYLVGNKGLLIEALEEFGSPVSSYKRALEEPEYADVTIRCYLLQECISEVLDEIRERLS